MPIGRPTDYDPKFCEMLIEHMTQGLSFECFAGVVGVARSTLYEWVDNHIEFSDTYMRAKALCQLHWEKMGMQGMWDIQKGQGKFFESRKLNDRMWNFNMKNRFGWRDNPPDEKQDQTIIIKIDESDTKL